MTWHARVSHPKSLETDEDEDDALDVLALQPNLPPFMSQTVGGGGGGSNPVKGSKGSELTDQKRGGFITRNGAATFAQSTRRECEIGNEEPRGDAR